MQYEQAPFPIAVLNSQKAHLLVVIDSEEEFDWSKGFSRERSSVRHMRSIGIIQKIFDTYHIVPIYVVNYSIASQEDGFLPLKDYLCEDRCIIGAHMHPWINPPFKETVSPRNSFPGNLPSNLESAKLDVLCKCIEKNFGMRPNIYKAGRYGLGPNTIGILERQDFEFDTSVCPYTSFSGEEGPDYAKHGPFPHWFSKEKKLLELPLTVGFEGRMRRWGRYLYPKLTRDILQRAHIPGIFSHMRLLNRVNLSPEGNTIDEMIRLVRGLYKDGLRVFTIAFHSPSVEPGNTPYVRSRKDLSDFISRLTQFFDFFFGEMEGQSSTPAKVRAAAAPLHTPSYMEAQ